MERMVRKSSDERQTNGYHAPEGIIMTESETPPKSFKTIHWVALVLLFLMMAQPTFDNTRALMSGKMVMGDISIDVTPAKMTLHLIAMVVGWVGLVLFFKRKKMLIFDYFSNFLQSPRY